MSSNPIYYRTHLPVELITMNGWIDDDDDDYCYVEQEDDVEEKESEIFLY